MAALSVEFSAAGEQRLAVVVEATPEAVVVG